MPLTSRTFSGEQRLEDCLVEDSAHLTIGTRGEAVAKVQAALIFLDELRIDETELVSQTYGESTAAAVLSFKKQRQIINHSYQNTADNIVGKMTIRRLDDELALAEKQPSNGRSSRICSHFP